MSEAPERIVVDRCRTFTGVDYWAGHYRREDDRPHPDTVSSHTYVPADLYEAERALNKEMLEALGLMMRPNSLLRDFDQARQAARTAIAKAEARERRGRGGGEARERRDE